jgi:hypothetical protein
MLYAAHHSVAFQPSSGMISIPWCSRTFADSSTVNTLRSPCTTEPPSRRLSVSQLLARKLRAETKMMIPALNDITIPLRGERTSNELGQETAARSLNMIPPTSISLCSRIILVVDIGRTLSWQSVIRFARSIQHFQTHLQVGLSAHRWSTSGSSSQGKNDIRNKPIYPRGIPVSMNDCAYFELVFTFHDYATAQASVETVYQTKVAMVEAHRDHRLCPVRYELDKLLQSFEPARSELAQLVHKVYEHMVSKQRLRKVCKVEGTVLLIPRTEDFVGEGRSNSSYRDCQQVSSFAVIVGLLDVRSCSTCRRSVRCLV